MNFSLNNFEKQSKKTWRKAAEKFLKGKPYETLVRQLDEHTQLEPYYTREEIQELTHLKCIQNDKLALDEPVNLPRFWYNQPCIEVKQCTQIHETNKEIRQVLLSGAEGVLIDISALEEELTKEDWNNLLFEVALPYCAVSFKVKQLKPVFLGNYLHYAKSQNVALTQLIGGIIQETNIIPTEELHFLLNLMQEGEQDKQIEQNTKKIYPFSIQVSTASDEAQTVANALLQLKNYADLLGKDSLPFIQLVVHASDDFFMTACKLRALRWLVQQVYALYELDIKPFVHCFTTLGTDEKSVADEHWNLIRNTTQALSCVLGGADSLTVLPHQPRITTNWATRIARNVSTILCEESFIDKVADPLAGSYYAEQLTDKLIAIAWRKFQEQC